MQFKNIENIKWNNKQHASLFRGLESLPLEIRKASKIDSHKILSVEQHNRSIHYSIYYSSPTISAKPVCLSYKFIKYMEAETYSQNQNSYNINMKRNLNIT